MTYRAISKHRVLLYVWEGHYRLDESCIGTGVFDI